MFRPLAHEKRQHRGQRQLATVLLVPLAENAHHLAQQLQRGALIRRTFMLHEHISKGVCTGFEANTEQQIGMMLAQFFIDKGSRHGLGWLGAEKYRHVGRQVFAKECVGELRIAQHLFENCVVDADDLTGHGWMSVGWRL